MIVFDLDGTLADCEHRRHFVDWHKTDYSVPYHIWKANWPAFYEACDKDALIIPTITLFNFLTGHYEIQIWSGRCESVRAKTNYWLMKHGVNDLTILNNIKMRPIGANTPDDVLKERWLDEAIAVGKTIDFVFDDRKKVIEMWNRRGIFVFDVSQGKGDF
jgi:hypothetical protein